MDEEGGGETEGEGSAERGFHHTTKVHVSPFRNVHKKVEAQISESSSIIHYGANIKGSVCFCDSDEH